MKRIVVFLLSLALLGGAAWGKGNTAAYARRVVSRHVEQELANPEWGASPFKLGPTAYRISKVTVDGRKVHVTVAFRVVFEQGCDFTYYYRPARWVSRTYDIPKTVLGTPEMQRVIMDDIMDRKRVAQIERSTLYYIIAGTFRSQAAARRRAVQLHVAEAESGFMVQRSSDYAGLRPGYFLVVAQYNLPWQTQSLAEARRVASLYRTRGIDCYIKRIPPLKQSAPHSAPGARHRR